MQISLNNVLFLISQEININKVGRSYSIVLKRQKCDWVETLKELRKEF